MSALRRGNKDSGALARSWAVGMAASLVLVGALATSFPSAASSPSKVRTSALVRVVAQGYSAKVHQFGATDVAFGLELRNTSHRLSAVGVDVTISFRALGGSWVPDHVTLDGIPPKGAFYVSGTTSGNPRPRSMLVTVRVDRATVSRITLPSILSATITRSALPSAQVRVSDPYSSSAMNGFAPDGTLYLVYYGAHDRIVGGDQISFAQDLFPGPGRSQIYASASPVPTGTSRVAASADLCDSGLGLVPSCPVYH